MKHMILMLFAFVATAFIITSCDPGKAAVQKFQSFYEYLDKNYDKLTQDQWKEATEKYQQLCEEVKNVKLSDELKKELATIQGKIVAKFTQKAGDEVKGALESAGSFLEGLFGGKKEEAPAE